jgi:hypothetical protein
VNKLSKTGNMLTRQARLRRYIGRPLIILIIIYIIARYHRYYKGNDFTAPSEPKSGNQFNININEDGDFVPNSGYKMLQHVIGPLSEPFSSIYSHLEQQTDLKFYFKLVPKRDFYVALTNLENKMPYKETDIRILETEQKLLDQNDTFTVCTSKQLLINEKYDIRLQIDLTEDYIVKLRDVQKRWDTKFASLIAQHYTSFHIILAYQYKDIPDREIYNQLSSRLNEWQQFPIEIELDPIEICSFTDAITYQPIVSDVFDTI